MTEEPEEDPEPEEEPEEESTPTPTHSCGAKLQKGMKYCPACGDEVNTDAYK